MLNFELAVSLFPSLRKKAGKLTGEELIRDLDRGFCLHLDGHAHGDHDVAIIKTIILLIVKNRKDA